MKAKIEGGEVKRTETSTKTSGEVVDLLAALQRSVDAAKTARGEERRDREARQEEGGEEGAHQEDRRQEEGREEDHQEGGGQEGELTGRQIGSRCAAVTHISGRRTGNRGRLGLAPARVAVAQSR